MKGAQLAFLVAIGFFAGCASSRTTALKLSGTPRAQFTVRYQSGKLSGALSSSTGSGAPSGVVEVSGRNMTCEIIKADPVSDLIAELVQDGEAVYRVEVPPGSSGIRIIREGKRWHHQLF
jgi:hypothetical protein